MDHHQQQQQRNQQPQRKPQQEEIMLKKKSVAFASDVSCMEIPNNDCYTMSQRKSMWYQASEYRTMTNLIRSNIDPPTNDDKEEDSESDDHQHQHDEQEDCEHTMLGMVTISQCKQRRENVKRSRIVVFREQQLQWEEGIVDVDLLADVYFDCTSYCQWKATEKGKKLSEDVQDMINDDIKIQIAKKRIRSLLSSSSSSSFSKQKRSSFSLSPSTSRRNRKKACH